MSIPVKMGITVYAWKKLTQQSKSDSIMSGGVIDTMKEYFGGIADKRQAGKVKHNLLEIIVMTVCGDSWM